MSENDPYIDQLIAGRYRVIRRLGEGGLGVVYLAEHVLIQKQVAIKMLRRRATTTDTRVEDLLKEARTAARVRNDHIVDITDFGRAESGDVFLVMEHLEGRSLAEEIFAEKRLGVERTLRIVDQICAALTVAHAADVIHCDLKPENIFLVPKPRRPDFVKILDFGIAAIRELDAPKTEDARPVVGTPEYMAPEQIRGMPPDSCFDIYSLGCILYEMLTGSPPFAAETPQALLTKHLTEQVERPSDRAPQAKIPPDLEAVVLRALAKNRKARFLTVRDLGLALVACRDPNTGARLVRRFDSDDTGIYHSPSAEQLTARAASAAARRGRRWRTVLALLVLLGVTAGGARWWGTRSGRSVVEDPAREIRARIATGELVEPRDASAFDRLRALRSAHPTHPALPGLSLELSGALCQGAAAALAVGHADRAVELGTRALELAPADARCAAALATAKRRTLAERAGMVAVGSFFIDRYEYPNLVGATPLSRVDWTAAKSLCEHGGKRLCTEAEWQLACAGANGRRYPYGNRYDAAACVTQLPDDAPHTAGSRPACESAFGAMDLSGNVAEWTASPVRDGAPQLVVKGGSWGDTRDKVGCESRDYFMPGLGGARHIGFRCCL